MSLESKKIEVEIARVRTARLEMEYIIDQRLDEIKRLEGNIKIQEEKEKELLERLKTAK
jgi:hypothetical protein